MVYYMLQCVCEREREREMGTERERERIFDCLHTGEFGKDTK